jgi:hypothetical protein
MSCVFSLVSGNCKKRRTPVNIVVRLKQCISKANLAARLEIKASSITLLLLTGSIDVPIHGQTTSE